MPSENLVTPNKLKVTFESSTSRSRTYTTTTKFDPKIAKILTSKETKVNGNLTVKLLETGQISITVDGSYSSYSTSSTPVYGTTSATAPSGSLPGSITSGGVTYSLQSTSSGTFSDSKTISSSVSGTNPPASDPDYNAKISKLWAAASSSVMSKANSVSAPSPLTYSTTYGTASAPYVKTGVGGPWFSGSGSGFTYSASTYFSASGTYSIGSYKGIVDNNYSYTYYYSYDVEIDLEINNPPTLVVRSNSGNQIINAGKVNHDISKPFTFSTVINDVDSGQTLSYKIVKDGITLKDWTTISSGSLVYNTISVEQMSTGTNSITVLAKDNVGTTEVNISFTIKNVVPKSYCHNDVGDLIKTLGFTPTDYRSLSSLKPTGYTKTTLSLAEIINFF